MAQRQPAAASLLLALRVHTLDGRCLSVPVDLGLPLEELRARIATELGVVDSGLRVVKLCQGPRELTDGDGLEVELQAAVVPDIGRAFERIERLTGCFLGIANEEVFDLRIKEEAFEAAEMLISQIEPNVAFRLWRCVAAMKTCIYSERVLVQIGDKTTAEQVLDEVEYHVHILQEDFCKAVARMTDVNELIAEIEDFIDNFDTNVDVDYDDWNEFYAACLVGMYHSIIRHLNSEAEEQAEPQDDVQERQPDDGATGAGRARDVGRAEAETDAQAEAHTGAQVEAEAEAETEAETDPVMLEQEELHEALLRSKAEGPAPISYDDSVAIFRLTRMCDEARHALRDAPVLADVRRRVEEAGCRVFLEAANGACLLVPLTEEQIAELGLSLRVHHVVSLRSDKSKILEALRSVPGKIRPKVRDDHRADTMQDELRAGGYGGAPAASSTDVLEEIEMRNPRVRDQAREFVARNLGIYEPSSERSLLTQSAPCGDAEPFNPRRWDPKHLLRNQDFQAAPQYPSQRGGEL